MINLELEVEVVGTMLIDLLKEKRHALESVAEAIRGLGIPAVTFIPCSTREQPDYSVWNIWMGVSFLEDTSTMSTKNSDTINDRIGIELVLPIFMDAGICDS